MIQTFSFFGLVFAVVMLAVVVISALILAVATLLTYLFSVSVWEAAVIVTVVAAGAYHRLSSTSVPDDGADYLLETPDDEDEIPRIVITELPDPPSQSRRKRRRL